MSKHFFVYFFIKKWHRISVTFQTHFDYHWDQFNPDQAPHVFQVAAEAYKRLRDTQTDQVYMYNI